MKYLPLIVLAIVTLFSCKPSPVKRKEKSKYFEGFVEFDESYTGVTDRFVNLLKSSFGAKFVTYVSAEGYFSRTFIDSNGIVLLKDIYRPDSLKFYEFNGNSDTVYFIDVRHIKGRPAFLGLTKRSAIKILGHNVDIIKTRQIDSSVSGYTLRTDAEYYNDDNYPVNPLIYKNIMVDVTEDAFRNSLYLNVGRKFTYNDTASVLAIANRIVPVSIPMWHFEIPKNKVLVEQ